MGGGGPFGGGMKNEPNSSSLTVEVELDLRFDSSLSFPFFLFFG